MHAQRKRQYGAPPRARLKDTPHLASAPDLERVTGYFFVNSKPKRSSERT